MPLGPFRIQTDTVPLKRMIHILREADDIVDLARQGLKVAADRRELYADVFGFSSHDLGQDASVRQFEVIGTLAIAFSSSSITMMLETLDGLSDGVARKPGCIAAA